MSYINIDSIIEKSNSLSFSIPLEILISWESSDEAWCLKKDVYQKPIYANVKYSSLIKPLAEGIPPALANFKHFIAIHDQRVMDEVRKIDAIGILPMGGDSMFSVFYCERMPFYDNKANVSGIISHIKPLHSVPPFFF